MKNQSSILYLRTMSSKKNIRNARTILGNTNGSRYVSQDMQVKQKSAARLMISSQICVYLGASESTTLRVGESLPNCHEDHICRKRRQFTAALQFGTQIYFLCLKLWKFQQQKQRWTRHGKKLEKFSAWNLTKVRCKKEVIDEARDVGALLFILHR